MAGQVDFALPGLVLLGDILMQGHAGAIGQAGDGHLDDALVVQPPLAPAPVGLAGVGRGRDFVADQHGPVAGRDDLGKGRTRPAQPVGQLPDVEVAAVPHQQAVDAVEHAQALGQLLDHDRIQCARVVRIGRARRDAKTDSGRHALAIGSCKANLRD